MVLIRDNFATPGLIDIDSAQVCAVLDREDFIDQHGVLDVFSEWVRHCANGDVNFFFPNSEAGKAKDDLPTLLHSPCLALCQRSGSGKTKNLYELGKKKEFVAYLLMDDRTYNRTDTRIREILRNLSYPFYTDAEFIALSMDQSSLITKQEAVAFSFICAISEYLLFHLRKHCLMNSPTDHVHNPVCFSGFFDIFKRSTDPLHSDAWETILSIQSVFYENFKEGLANVKGENLPFAKFSSVGVERIVIAIDEARELLKFKDQVNAFQILRDCLSKTKQMTNRKVCLIVTDTSSNITNFTPSEGDFHFHSSRTIASHMKLTPPFYLLSGQDLWGQKYLERGLLAFESGEWLKLLEDRDDHGQLYNEFACIGSPLWKLARDSISSKDALSIFGFAETKLLSSAFNTEESIMAALGSRLAIKFLPNATLSRELLANHMGLLYFLTHDRKQAFIGFPSDPSMAAGAFNTLKDGINGHKPLTCIEILLEQVARQNVDVGESGEVAIQILLQSSMDFIIAERLYNEKSKTDGADSRRHSMDSLCSTTVGQLFQTLFCEEYYARLKVTFEGDDSKIWNGRLFFNHAVVLEKKASLDDVMLCFVRGAVVAGCHTQPGWDVLIPVVLPDGTITSIQFQSKNHADKLSNTALASWKKKSLHAACDYFLPEGERDELVSMLRDEERMISRVIELEGEAGTKRKMPKIDQADPFFDLSDEDLLTRKAQVRNDIDRTYRSTCAVHILVNFMQGSSDIASPEFVADTEQRTVVIQGPVQNYFRSIWSHSQDTHERSFEALRGLLSNRPSILNLLGNSNESSKSLFRRSDHGSFLNGKQALAHKVQPNLQGNVRP